VEIWRRVRNHSHSTRARASRILRVRFELDARVNLRYGAVIHEISARREVALPFGVASDKTMAGLDVFDDAGVYHRVTLCNQRLVRERGIQREETRSLTSST
jgi:hypothetical protein